MANVVIVNAVPLSRKGIRDTLIEDKNISVVLESIEESEIRQIISKGKVDLVVLDLAIPGRDGLEILRMIKTTDPEIPVLVVTSLPEELYGVAALKNGAAGYIANESEVEEISSAVKKVLAGKRYISAGLAERLAEFVENGGKNLPHERLTMREFQVMLMIGQGMSVGEISEKLSLSYSTVATHRQRILTKMGLASTAQVVRYVSTQGMLRK